MQSTGGCACGCATVCTTRVAVHRSCSRVACVLRDDLEAKVNSLQAQLRTKETELEALNEECDELNNELTEVKRDKAGMEVQLHQLEAQKNDEDVMAGPKIKKLKAQIAELQDELDAQGKYVC